MLRKRIKSYKLSDRYNNNLNSYFEQKASLTLSKMNLKIHGFPIIFSKADQQYNDNSNSEHYQNTYHSYPVTGYQPRNSQNSHQITQKSNRFYSNQLLRQLQTQQENISNYRIIQDERNVNLRKLQKNKKVQLAKSQLYRPTQIQVMQQNCQQRNTRKIYHNPKESQKTQQQYAFKDIPQCDTIQDQDQEELGIDSPNYPKSSKGYLSNRSQQIMKSQMSKNQKRTKQKTYERHSKAKQQFFMHNAHQNQLYKQQKNQHYHLPTYPIYDDRQTFIGKNAGRSDMPLNKNLGRCQSDYPVLRDTLKRPEVVKQDFRDRLSQHAPRYHCQQSSKPSQSNGPRTNFDSKQSYRFKYKKYKQKYLQLIQIVQQLQSLNETLIADQRQNYDYYENTIKSLQSLLTVKDKQIQELSEHLNMSQKGNNNLSSIVLKGDVVKLKKQLESRNRQLKSLKRNIKSIDESFQATQKSKSSKYNNFENRIDLLKKEKQFLLKKSKALEELNQMYEQKLRDKQTRVNKMSAFNTQLQEQILKLKDRIHSDQTNDTEREFTGNFFRKQNHLNQLSSLNYSNSPAEISKNSQLERHLACIDQQLHLIRGRILSSSRQQLKQSQRDKQTLQLDLAGEIDLQESRRQKSDDNYLQQLKSMVQKLSDFRESMDV